MSLADIPPATTLRHGALALLAAGLTGMLVGAEPQVDSSQLPRVPATPPERAVATFKVKPGFRIELVAAEPLVVDPIAMSFDEDGRCYVVEMRDYSERRPERLGRIRLLEDTDGDGRFDKSTVFAQGLPWPTAVICWNGGVFVGATPDIIYFKDTNGDRVADIQEPIFTGFASDYAPFATNKLNVQAMMNSFNWSLDNRIHGATSFSGGKVRRRDSAYVSDWLKRNGVSPTEARNETLDLRGRDFSFDPRTLEMRAESGGGQHGLSFDNRGRKFVCSNSSHIQALMYEQRYADRNRYYSMPRALVDIAVDGGAAPVFRISPDEPWRVIRTQWRVAGLVSGPIEGGGKPSGYFTGATGVTIYRGDAFEPEFVGDAFVGDAGGNLLHRKKVLQDGVGVKAVRPTDEQNVEFLASTDNWFRPVQMANAPDGCLYICDMYREVIEHPWSLPDSIKKHLDLNSGNDRGRIYRVVPDKFKQRPVPRLSKATSPELAALLEHPNGWHRETGARLLCERRDKSAEQILKNMAGKSASPFGRMHALLVLDGIGLLDEPILLVALKDDHEMVRQQAVRLSEKCLDRFGDSQSLARSLSGLTADTSPLVRHQLAFALGALAPRQRVEVAAALVIGGIGDHWIQQTLLHSLGESGADLFFELGRRQFEFSDAGDFLPSLAALIGTHNRPEAVAAILSNLPSPAGDWYTLATTRGLARGLETRGRSLAEFDRGGKLEAVFALARDRATNNRPAVLSSGADLRKEAIAVLGFAPYPVAAPVLLDLLKPEYAPGVQLATVSALARFPEASLTMELLKRRSSLSPMMRGEVIALLLKRAERALAVLEAIQRGTMQVAELSPAQIDFLRNHRDEQVRQESARVLGRQSAAPRDNIVTAFMPSLKLRGTAANGHKTYLARCATCHKIGTEGHALGPDFATVKNAGKEKLLTNIIDPNREVNANYLSYLVETRDGESFAGLILNETGNELTIRMAGGLENIVARSHLASMQNQGKSIMPEGLEEGLSQQDMADLLEFIVATP